MRNELTEIRFNKNIFYNNIDIISNIFILLYLILEMFTQIDEPFSLSEKIQNIETYLFTLYHFFFFT